MKKLVSIVLLFAMLFSLSACSFLPGIGEKTESDTETNTQTATGTNTQTNTNTNTNTGTYVPPILDHDTITYAVKYSKDKKKIYFGSYSFKAPAFTEYYNDYEAALSMTFDDGADIAAANLANDIMEQYGFKGTLMVNIGSIQGNVSKWQELVAKGTLDIGCHGWSHLDPSTITQDQMEHEIKDAYDYLWEHFPDEKPVTYATPFSRLTDSYTQYLKETGFIANRLEVGGTMISPKTENPNMYALYSKRIDTGNNIESMVRTNVDGGLSAGNWFIELYHNVRTQDGTDVPEADFRAHCQWLYETYNGKVWFASYDDVAKYIVQRQNATIEYTAVDNESMTFVAKVNEGCDYGQEMTAKFYLPFFADSAYAIIDGEEVYLTLKKETNARSVMLNIPVTESGTEIKIVFGGNDKYFNNCTHTYVENEVVEPTYDTYGYTEMICTNPKCEHTYKSKYTDKLN